MDSPEKMEHSSPLPYPDNSSSSLDQPVKLAGGEHLENIRTISRVPGNDHYYEKDGLRTYGDNEDHEHEWVDHGFKGDY
jgi:hypothetical protein